MNGLISRAAAIEQMKKMAGCAKCVNYGYVKCRTCSWNDAMNNVDELPAVDAIPAEWLEDRVYDMKRASLYRRYAEMLLVEWLQEREEQETR